METSMKKLFILILFVSLVLSSVGFTYLLFLQIVFPKLVPSYGGGETIFINSYNNYTLFMFISIKKNENKVNIILDNETEYVKEIQEIRNKINRGFKEDKDSPLTSEDRSNFTGLNFFPIDEKYKFICSITQESDTVEEVQLETSKGDMRLFIKYGKLEFKVQDSICQLLVFKVKDQDYYFTPFMDSTNGKETYCGGRYVNLEKLENNEFVLDFNLAYNPSCAYSDEYSCVLVPFENRLSIPIDAGVKKFH